MKSIFYLAVALLSVITIVNGHANHDGHDHYIEQVHEHYIRAEDPVKVTPGEIVDVNLARRGTISKRDLFVWKTFLSARLYSPANILCRHPAPPHLQHANST